MTAPGFCGEQSAQILALVELVGRTGAEEWTLRYCDEEAPIAWIACARHGEHWSIAGAEQPVRAMVRLAEALMDGGTCRHCGKCTGVDLDHRVDPLMAMSGDLICWYRWDPEVRSFRRSCEGVAA